MFFSGFPRAMLWILILAIALAGCGTPAQVGPAPANTAAPAAPTHTPDAASQPTSTRLPIENHTPRPPVENPTPQPTLPIAADSHAKDPTTWVQVQASLPQTLDPALDYESIGGGVLFHVYDTLVAYEKDNPASLIPSLAVDVPTLQNGGISADGLTYTFHLRPAVMFHDGSPLTAEDVAYTFQRGLLQGGSGSPQWLFSEALFGQGIDDVAVLVNAVQPPYDDREKLSRYPAADLEKICTDLKKAIQADDTTGTVTFTLKQPWAPFLAAFPGSWGSILSKNWALASGGWDGNCKTWQNTYAPTLEQSLKTPLGTTEMGTGPFRLDHWTTGVEMGFTANPAYWRTQPAWPGGPVGAPALQKVILRKVDEFSSQLKLVQDGDADLLESGPDTWDVLDRLVGETCDFTSGDCQFTAASGQILRRWIHLPTDTRRDVFFTFQLNQTESPYIGSGKLDGQGVPPDFFSDVHVRRAFSYCFDYDTYHAVALQNEGQRAAAIFPPGLPGAGNTPGYTFDLEKCAAELKASSWKSEDGRSLWDTGFRIAIPYPAGSTASQTVSQIWQRSLARINPKFVIEITGLPWQSYVRGQMARQLPVFFGRWLMDIYDSHNLAVPYTTGAYANRQGIPSDMQAAFRTSYLAAAVEQNAAERELRYADFDRLFTENTSAVLLFQLEDRVYLPRYVQGWYYNPLLPMLVNWYAVSKK